MSLEDTCGIKAKRAWNAGLQLLAKAFVACGCQAKDEYQVSKSRQLRSLHSRKGSLLHSDSIAAAAAIEMVVLEMQKAGKPLKKMFLQYEKTNQSSDGTLTTEEFTQMLSDNMKTKNRDAVQDIVNHASRSGTQKLSYDTVFKELIVEFIAHRLNKQGQTFREFFQDLDPHFYGFASASTIRAMLLEHGIMSQDADSFLAMVDLHSDGRVRYTDLFNLCSDSLLEENSQRHQDQEYTLKAVVIVTRHGARFPLKSFPNSTHWPKSKSFWEGTDHMDESKASNDYAGRLTPVGCEQHLSLGQTCRKKWIDKEQLIDVNDPMAPSCIVAYTSNSDRTLKSAQSFLRGMFPEMPPRFVVDADEKRKLSKEPNSDGVDSAIVEDEGLAGIPIIVDSENYTNVLHGFKCSDKYDSLKHEAFKVDKKNGKLGRWAKDPKFGALVAKLWDMTLFKKMNLTEKKDIAACLSNMQSIAQSIGIERAHSMPLLRNTSGLVLTPEDEEKISEVARHVCNTRYCGNNSQMQKEMARHAAGLLPSEIVNFFTSRRDADDNTKDDEQGRFRMYSAHDNSVMAMLAHLGFKDFDVPEFAAFLAFELHKKADGSWFVRFLYNPDPHVHIFPDMSPETRSPTHQYGRSNGKANFKEPLQYIKFPEQSASENEAPIVSMSSAEEGEMPLDKFVEILMVQQRSFADQEQWEQENCYGLKRAKDDLEALEEKEKNMQQQLEQLGQQKSLLQQRIKSMEMSTSEEVKLPQA